MAVSPVRAVGSLIACRARSSDVTLPDHSRTGALTPCIDTALY
jgi:hypothetical protein